MKKPTAADIAKEFAEGAAKERIYIQCRVCNLPEEIRDAVTICLTAEPPMTSAALSRQLLSKGHKVDPQSLRRHVDLHARPA